MREDQFKPFSESESVSLEQIKLRCLSPGKTTFTCMADRPGIMGWMTQVEYIYFKPDTDANDDFWLITMNWPEDNPMLWVVITIPTTFEEKCVALLWQHGLKALKHQLAIVFGGPK
jgi:hypothetical protein